MELLALADLVVIIIILLATVSLGVLVNKNESSDTVVKYFLGNESMPLVLVSLSFIATFYSGIYMCGIIGEMYLYGFQFRAMDISNIIGIVILVKYATTVFLQIKIISVFQYLEKRFDTSLRLGFSILYQLTNFLYIGVVLYVPSVSFTAVSGVPYYISCLVIGVSCTIYCVVGGYKAVVWTDVLQACLMFLCFLLIIGNGMINGVGLVEAVRQSYEGNRLQVTFTEDMHTRYSFWSLIAYGFSVAIQLMTINQAGVQRLISVKDHEASKKTIYISSVLIILFSVFLTLSACFVYALLKDCDPLSSPTSGVKSLDQILVYSIFEMLKHTPGLAGLAFSGIMSGSLSTISSFINSFSAVTMQDILKPHFPNLTKSESKNLFICKLLTAFYGGITILMSFAIPHIGGAFKIYSSIITAIYGPLSAIMLLGFFAPRCNARTVKLALLCGLVIVLWLAIGMRMTNRRERTLPLSVEGCEWQNRTLHFNNSSFDWYSNTTIVTEIQTTNLNVTKVDNLEFNDEFSIYKISHMWIGPIGVTLTFIAGILLSYIFGDKDCKVDPRLLSPAVVSKNDKLLVYGNCEDQKELQELKT